MPRHWYVVHTHGGKELVANLNLSRQGYEVFVPMHLQPVRRRTPRYRPLFQNYVFVIFDADYDLWQPIMHTYGVRRLLVNRPEHPHPIPDRFIESLRSQVLPTPTPSQSQIIYTGCMVRVLRGHFANQEALVKWTASDRVKLMLAAMGSEVEVEFNAADLVPI